MSTYDDASLIYYPSGYKASKAYSLKPTDGSGDLTFTRASTATRVNEQGLIEGVRTNSLLYSEQFDNAYWSKSLGTLTANSAISPDGTTTAEKWEKTSGANSLSRVFISTSPYGSIGVYTYSVFLKNIDSTSVLIRMDSAGNTANLTFDWVSVTGSGANVINVGFDNYGNGWSRVWITANVTSIAWSLDSMVLYADVAGKSLYLWGAMLEQSVQATEYIPTTTTAVSVGMLANVPRIDYTGAGCAKLLLEPQRTNLATYSSEFDNAAWVKVSVTITANVTTSPDGTTNADKLIPSATGNNFIFQSLAGSGTQTNSFFVKAGGKNFCWLLNAAGSVSSYFNLANGTVAVNASGTAKIESFGNGWYRISETTTSVSGNYLGIGPSDVAGNGTSTVNGTDGIFVFGGQNELGSYSTSYIPTATTAVTRVKDSFNLNNIYSNGLISASGGTLFIEFKTKAFRDNGDQIVYIGDASNQLFIYGGSDGISFIVARFLGGAFSNVYLSSANTNNNIKLAFKWDGTFLNIFENGVKVVTNNSFTAINLPNFIGQGTNDFNIQSTMLFPTPLSDSDLITLTTL